MLLSQKHHRLELPATLRDKLYAFRRRVWSIKLMEAAGCALFGVLGAYLITFIIDRLWDTPEGVRLGIFAAALVVCAVVPLALYRWVYRQRRLDQLARLLTRKHASMVIGAQPSSWWRANRSRPAHPRYAKRPSNRSPRGLKLAISAMPFRTQDTSVGRPQRLCCCW